MDKADIGLVGLGVMGENLALNMANKGFCVAVFNRTVTKVDEFLKARAKGQTIIGAHTIQELVRMLKPPRKIFLMIKAGKAIDDFIESLLPCLTKGDIIIDGGNSFYADTTRRCDCLEDKGYLYIGAGVSGGEEGALRGPSIMPGGSFAAWEAVKPILQAIAAKVDGSPCCEWVGRGGAGHFVKMVHNGIEYGDMQLIGEAYQLMKDVLGMSAEQMHAIFKTWNLGDLESFLIEITGKILQKKDDKTGRAMVDVILDAAAQKGTGKWTVTSALDLGIPVTLIGEAVFSRQLSALKDQRTAASKILSGPEIRFSGDKAQFIDSIRDALFASKIVSYAQGFALMQAAAAENGWDLHYGRIALLWRGGCIIRAAFLSKIKEAFDQDPQLSNLLLAPYFKMKIDAAQQGWRRVAAAALSNGVAVPAITSALAFYDGYRCARLPANLLQAQRDFFGAHTYERTDTPRGQFFHTKW